MFLAGIIGAGILFILIFNDSMQSWVQTPVYFVTKFHDTLKYTSQGLSRLVKWPKDLLIDFCEAPARLQILLNRWFAGRPLVVPCRQYPSVNNWRL